MSCTVRLGLVLMLAVTMFPRALPASTLTILSPDLPSQSEPGGKGRDSEIVATVLEHCGYYAKFRVVPFGRHIRSFSDYDSADAVTTVPADRDVAGYPSKPYIWYQNGASVLQSSRVKPYTLAGLADLRVVAFANAREILGLEDIIGTLDEYQELSNQRLHSSMLYFGRVDVVLSDGLIFSEINTRMARDPQFRARVDMTEPLLFTPLFDPEPFRLVFRDRKVRDAFNQCFSDLEGRGLIRAINVRHVDRHRDVVGHGYLGY